MTSTFRTPWMLTLALCLGGCIAEPLDVDDNDEDTAEAENAVKTTKSCKLDSNPEWVTHFVLAKLRLSATHIVGYDIEYNGGGYGDWSYGSKNNEHVYKGGEKHWSSPDKGDGNEWIVRDMPNMKRTWGSFTIKAVGDKGWSGDPSCKMVFVKGINY